MAVVRVASRLGVPIVPRGGGTGLAGGAVPTQGGVVINMTRMNRIIEIDTANMTATVQPGVVTARLQSEVESAGPLLPAGPAIAAPVHARGQYRHRGGRAALPQVRHDPRLCTGFAGGARRWAHYTHRRQDDQDADRLQSDSAFHGLRGHAGRDHRSDAAPHTQTSLPWHSNGRIRQASIAQPKR